ncbi:disease resistance protein RPV1-like isoform X2 [Cryptomeria japonica]|uniref:disease resistance protein RPV1-like isoform X2 n=1 Tax=Cryptomeria japonica TaxID=3369 RepID=UPI0027DA1A43|nr:disease resistance protein RPV1-like isoform X2 [Cryptomeria japonica]
MATPNETTNAFEEVVPPSASSSKPGKRVPCDVFINHRGPDTKHTLATSLYHALKSMGLEVFLDQPELELGDFIPSEIQDAMTTSFLHIAILSPKYADSPWCLAELSFMLKSGNTIIPVFYEVDPGAIRWTAQEKGVYTDAFAKHKENGRYSAEKLENWKVALQNVTYLTGYIVKDNDDEGKEKLLKAIKDYIHKHSQKIPLVVANFPVGLDEILQDFERNAFDSSENIKIVGIVGMGGCGKTTLAKEYYNKTRLSIYKCSFIHNVRDGSKRDLYNKQKKMLQDLGFNDAGKVDNVEIGKAILAKRLKSIQVFIILDDVEHQDQLESLLPVKDSLGQGSVIIVTSRESGVLTSWGISSIYKMKELNREHAMKLFCWYAFRQPYPINGFENLVQNFLKVCKGLPLSLKVLGGLVHGMSEDYWNSQLNKVSRILPEDIKSILKVSFDALDKEEKDVFLDISCFFIGIEEQSAVTVWDGSGWSGQHSLVRLKNKCLVELDEWNCITMHDHLRDMGKEIALEREIDKSPYRLWSPEQIRDIEIEGQDGVLNRGIRGIRAETDEFYEECMNLVEVATGSGKRFKRQLEILFVHNNYFTGELATLSAGLVWLRWVNFPHSALQLWLPLKKLRILELENAEKLEELWSETADPPVQLRELIISDAKRFQRFPSSIGRLLHLKKISLGWIREIVGLPEEFCQLQSLEHLDICGCHKLQLLPSRFGDLKNLRHLDLRGAGLMMLPASFRQLINLQYICLLFCLELTLHPDILENMTKLEAMLVSGCELQELPAQIINQQSLKTLNVGSRSLMELPNGIGHLSKLEALTIGSSSLKSLPPSIGNLSSLIRLEICSEKLESLPETLTQLTSLHSLHIRGCPLRELDILSGCSSSSLYSLKFLNVEESLVSRISISEQCCPSLESLSLRDNRHLVEIDSLPTSVKTIELITCEKLKSISSVSSLVNLEKLVLRKCGEELQGFPNFEELVSLKKFEITEAAEQMKIIEGLEYCRSLETLILHAWWKVPVITSLENMESLRSVELLAWNDISTLEHCLQTIKRVMWRWL